MSDIFILEDSENTSKQTKKHLKKWNFLDGVNAYLLTLQSLKTKEKVILFRLMSTMLNAGLSILKALSILEAQEKNPVLKWILSTFIKEIKWWKWFSECLAMYPASFWDAEIWVVESWEKTWKLNQSLTQLADQVEKLDSISSKLKWAMMYPAMIVVVVVWVVWVMMTMVVPKLLEIFWYDPTLALDNPINVSAMAALPASTNFLIWISNFFTNYWLLMIVWWFISVIFLKIWKQTPDGKYNWDKMMLHVPVFWEINKKLILSKFARVLSSLLSSWVSIVESLRITAEAVWSEVYRQRIMMIRDDIKQWHKIYESIEWDKLFPEMLIQMVQVWEQTAKLDSIILKLADFYDEQVDNTISVINKLLEPIIIVFMAVVVWFIAIAIMQPIMNLADQVTK